jgi:hypothetical protein
MGLFSTSYDKNYEVSCVPPYDSDGYLKKPGENVRFIDRMYVTPVKVASGISGNALRPAKYKFYINKTDIDKIQTGTISRISYKDSMVYYTITTPNGVNISSQGYDSSTIGTFDCYQRGTLLFLQETNPPAGGKKRRYTKKQRKTRTQRKTRKSNHRVKSYKRRD